MLEILSRMPPGEFIGLTSVVLGCLTGMVAIVSGVWYNARKVEAETALKRELLASGMTADEIARVVSATAGCKVPAPRA